ncbi:hypothetical protein PM082_011353 [Marasmius tenuissimus]|nr:hypothetical protein PM082_011353 [Marasmius tenuissimus]
MHYSRYLQIFALLLVIFCLVDAAPAKAKPKTVAKKTSVKKTPAKIPASRPASPVSRPASPAGKVATKKKTTSPPPSRPASPVGNTSTKGKEKAKTPPPSRPASPANGQSGAADTPKTGTQTPANDACAAKTTCESCLKAKCEFDVKGKKCFAKGTTPPAGAIVAKGQPVAGQCKKAAAQLASESGAAPASKITDLEFQQAAQAAFGRLQRHVLGTSEGGEPTSGRHLASSFVKFPENLQNYQRKSNAETGLSQFTKTKGEGPSKKTTWDDDLKQYSAADVRSVCQRALEAVLRLQDSKTLNPTSITSVSVRPPGKNFNICVTVQGITSVFPKNTAKASAASGQRC